MSKERSKALFAKNINKETRFMKKVVCILTACLLFAACGTTPGNGEETGTDSEAFRSCNFPF
jgi:uncharacterized lipoprotein YajG